MKVISFNANGIRAAARKGFYTWLHQQNADFVCLQETKAQINQLTQEAQYHPSPYYCEYADAQKKGYSGVAIYARFKPLRVIKHIGYQYCDDEGRYLQFDYPNLSVISLYLPSGTQGEVRQAVKWEFLARFKAHFLELLQQGRELIICGDYNIAHRTIDLKNWRNNQKNSGFLPAERAWMDDILSLGLSDAFRIIYPHEAYYTWWTYRGQAYANDVGWRIDYQLITKGLVESVQGAAIAREMRWSDHAPLTIDYAGVWHV
ncbi:MAG: exodeoxyribonuclease III [Legionellaceae bacterium]|nr:exodeoxyribonuclease III [Legionellaceae bacterium]HAF87320.1 exodeoxyribonuclease III [Legionellales bacterium]HCA89051.1 exodeoxyribonuclease III [Legionellales bacterium]